MSQLDDQDLQPSVSPPEGERPARRRPIWVGLLVVAALGALLVAFFLGRVSRDGDRGPAPSNASKEPVEVPGSAPPEEEPPLPPLPTLDRSDAFVEEMMTALGTAPRLRRLASGGDLIRRLTAAVDNLAEGASPRNHFGGPGLEEPFRARPGSDGRLRIDPDSYRRYDGWAEAVAGLDANALASAFRRLEPLIESAYGELGYPGRSFSQTLAQALSHLLATPVPEEPPEVRLDVITYGLVDSRLEALSPAQKHLLRMGPENANLVLAKLRELEAALALAPLEEPAAVR
ncbi:MAG: DUF3014 domain-containing protein [Acidobacteriota bacterium]